MSVLSRKMFNRGARKELRKKGGIEDVQYFQAAGPVTVSVAGGVPTGVATSGRPSAGVGLRGLGFNPRLTPVVGQVGANIPGAQKGQTFLAPYTQGMAGGFTAMQRVLKKAAEGGTGSLTPFELGLLQTLKYQAQTKKDADALRAAPDFGLPGLKGAKKGLANVYEAVSKYGIDPLVGMASGPFQALLAGDPKIEAVPEDATRLEKLAGIGSRIGASGQPTKELMESYGFEFFPTSGEELERFKRRQSNIDANILSKDEGEKRKELALTSSDAINAALAASAQSEGKSTLGDSFYDTFKGTTVDVDPKTGNVKVTEDPSKPDPISQEEIQKVDAEDSDQEKITEEQVGQILGRGIDGTDEKLTEENSVTIINNETNQQEKVPDLQKADIENPITRPDNWSNIVANAKTNTGVESNVVDAGAVVKMDREKGLGTVEDFKADLMKLLPEYGKDTKRDMGMYLAMIGFSIASGNSPNAITNIAKGVMKILPSIMKDKKDEKKYKRQVESIAAQYAIKKADVIEQENRKENNYFVQKAFEDPTTGEQYSVGQLLPLNKAGYATLREAGFGGNLTSEKIYEKMLNEANELAKAKVTSNLKVGDINKLYTTQTFDIFGLKVDYNTPSAAGLESGRREGYIVNPNQLQAVVSAYSQKVGEMQTVVATIGELRNKALSGEATGPGGVVSRFKDAFVEFVGPTRAKNLANDLFGVDLDTALGTANQFTASQRMLTLKLTPLLLGESAKTISDADRLRVAKAMGFEDATITNKSGTNFGGSLDLGKQDIFKSRQEIVKALDEVEKRVGEVIGGYNSELNVFAEQIGKPLGDIQPAAKGIQDDFVASYTFDDKGKMTKDT